MAKDGAKEGYSSLPTIEAYTTETQAGQTTSQVQYPQVPSAVAEGHPVPGASPYNHHLPPGYPLYQYPAPQHPQVSQTAAAAGAPHPPTDYHHHHAPPAAPYGYTVPIVVCTAQVPETTHCWNCRQVVMPEPALEDGACTWLTAGILCAVGCWFLSCLPFCMQSTKDTVFKCPHCRTELYRVRRL